MIAETTTSRQRVLKALNFEPTNRLVKDLGGITTTGISAFAYPKLVEALGLPPRLPRVHDTYQMLAMPDVDVLETLGCDVVTNFWGVTNAFDEPEKWQEYDFNGRLPALVRDRSSFQEMDSGTIIQPERKLEMPPTSYFFDEKHGGQPLDWTKEILKDDLGQIEKELKENLLTDEQIEQITEYCRQIRQSTDRAIVFQGPINIGLTICGRGGLAVFSILCMTEPNYVADLHTLLTEYAIKNTRKLLPEIQKYIDIIMLCSADWGTQDSLVASPEVFRTLFMPFFKQINDWCHKIAPQVKTFLHSCGAIYDILDFIIEGGFDVLNPVQWMAGGHSYKEWKDKCRKRIALWGGGVNSQTTLPFGTIEEIEKEVSEIVKYLNKDSGYIFNSTHNILADIPPEKIIAMYQTAAKLSGKLTE